MAKNDYNLKISIYFAGIIIGLGSYIYTTEIGDLKEGAKAQSKAIQALEIQAAINGQRIDTIAAYITKKEKSL